MSDGTTTTTETVTISVALSGEGSNAPFFIQPLGTGTTLDLATQTILAEQEALRQQMGEASQM